MSESPWLIVGLGNPGERYASNRHNLGEMVVDAVAAGHDARFSAHRARAQVAQIRLAPQAGQPGPALILGKPSGYMNTSGGPVAALVSYFKIPLERLLIVHDELDLAFGDLRLKRGGGEGGHNGLRSISTSLGAKDFGRLRMGIGRPPGRMDAADFVLRDFSSGEREDAAVMVGQAQDVVIDLVRQGWERTQNEVNTRTR